MMLERPISCNTPLRYQKLMMRQKQHATQTTIQNNGANYDNTYLA